jgi:hypothetical protein
LGKLLLSGSTFWMNWLRRPRLNNALHKVAVLTVLSLSRVLWLRGMSVFLEIADVDGGCG